MNEERELPSRLPLLVLESLARQWHSRLCGIRLVEHHAVAPLVNYVVH